MPLTDFGRTSDCPYFDGDGAISFELPASKRNIRLLGLPIRCAASCSVHNAPGLTFNSASIARMCCHGSRPNSLHVATSRARSIQTLFILEDIPAKDIIHLSCGPSTELDEELEQLRDIERKKYIICAKHFLMMQF